MQSMMLFNNDVTTDGASAIAYALEVNASVAQIDLSHNRVDKATLAVIENLLARNKRLRCLFLFEARQMLLSVLCADECGVVWPYLLREMIETGEYDENEGIEEPDNIDALRTVYAAVCEERRRRTNDAETGAAACTSYAPGVCSVYTCARPSVSRCGRCKRAFYCVQTCQVKHWRSGHREECNAATTSRAASVSKTSSCTSSARAVVAMGVNRITSLVNSHDKSKVAVLPPDQLSTTTTSSKLPTKGKSSRRRQPWWVTRRKKRAAAAAKEIM
jgi:hypothetical protein